MRRLFVIISVVLVLGVASRALASGAEDGKLAEGKVSLSETNVRESRLCAKDILASLPEDMRKNLKWVGGENIRVKLLSEAESSRHEWYLMVSAEKSDKGASIVIIGRLTMEPAADKGGVRWDWFLLFTLKEVGKEKTNLEVWMNPKYKDEKVLGMTLPELSEFVLRGLEVYPSEK